MFGVFIKAKEKGPETGQQTAAEEGQITPLTWFDKNRARTVTLILNKNTKHCKTEKLEAIISLKMASNLSEKWDVAFL